MALKIRLSRGGAKKRPFYHIVIADSRSPRDGRFIERVGTYNPMVPRESSERVTVKEDRIKYWLSVGALPSDRVARFLAVSGLVEKPVLHEQTKQHLPKAKAQERMQEANESSKTDSETPTQDDVVETANSETPAEEISNESSSAEPSSSQVAEEMADSDSVFEDDGVEVDPSKKSNDETSAEEISSDSETEEKVAG